MVVNINGIQERVSECGTFLLGSRWEHRQRGEHYANKIVSRGSAYTVSRGAVGKALGDEYLKRYLPERNTYLPPKDRALSPETVEKIGLAYKEAQERGGHKLSAGALSIAQGKVNEIIREAYTKVDNSGNIQTNRQLEKEIIDRYSFAVDQICNKLDDISLGFVDNPIQELKKIRSMLW